MPSDSDSGTGSHVIVNLEDSPVHHSSSPHYKTMPDSSGQTSVSLKRINTNASRLLSDVSKGAQMPVHFKHVCAWVPVLSLTSSPLPSLPKLRKQSNQTLAAAPKEKQVLFNISGTVSPGEVLALMGPSGSGKSSLLAVLGGRSTARTTGEVLFDSKPLSKSAKRKLGYVTQDDQLYEELTVYETLYYAALLRLPRSWEHSAKIERVELVLAGLGLDKCRNTMIGNHMIRGVSGGERKRVSIGHELLINPSVVFLDEPTSGLDSTTALKLMHTLRTLASGGRTIITSIHQPASRLYQQMDKLLLLSDGHTMFYGDAHAAMDWFAHLGQPCKPGTNIADHILDLACGDVAAEDPDDVKERLVAAYEKRPVGLGPDGIQASDITSLRTGHPPEADDLAHDSSSWQEANGSSPDSSNEKWGASWFEQLKYLTVRSVKTRRLGALSWQKFAQQLVVAVLAGLFWFQIGAGDLSRQDVIDVGGLLFLINLFLSFAALFSALYAYPPEFRMVVKERQSGMYRLSAYYLARSVADLPMDCLVPTFFVWIVYWMTGLRIDAGAFFSHWFAVMLIVLVAQSVGLLIGATVINPSNGVTVATIFMLGVMLVGGFYVRSIPIWIDWLKYVSFIYWAWNLLLKIEFRHRPLACSELFSACADETQPAVIPLTGRCSVADSDIFEVNVDESVARDVCVLIGMFLVTRLVTYYALQYKTTFRKRV